LEPLPVALMPQARLRAARLLAGLQRAWALLAALLRVSVQVPRVNAHRVREDAHPEGRQALAQVKA